MKKLLLTHATALLFANTFAKTLLGSGPDVKQQQSAGIRFIENKGQVHDQNYKARPDVLYGVMTGNMAVHIKNNGVSYQLYKSPSPTLPREERASSDPFFVKAPFSPGEGRGLVRQPGGDEATIYRIDLTWQNANTNFTRSEDEALPGYDNYYLENCPEGALNVKSYRGITLKNLYKEINLHYYEKNGDLKHDYIVAPHADYKQIQLEIEGAEVSLNPDGSLMLTTPLGKVQEGAPIVYQNGKQLNAKWQIKNNILSFQVENYDPNFELVIDPVTRLWGTYYGGVGNVNNIAEDIASGCTTDASGNVYMSGSSSSSLGIVIATVGSHQSAYGGGNGGPYGDAFLVKFNANGVRQWATYYGGSGQDNSGGCVTDASGNIYMGGSTTSTSNVIATIGSHQPIYGGGGDAFLVKFNSNGIRLWGTFYGGTGYDWGGVGPIDAFGNVYVTGSTDTPTGTAIATIGSHQPVKSTGRDAFLVKFDANGLRLWGTYYGGIGSDDRGGSCATDASGNVYMSGQTNSPITTANGTAIATPGSHQPAGGGTVLDYDAFLVKFDANGIRLWGTYYGGAQSEWGGGSCATDGAGNVYLAGATSSSVGTVIATTGSHQPVFGGPVPAFQQYTNDGFLVKFNSNGIRQWGTYYGGTERDIAHYCTTDVSGNVYLSGQTTSSLGTVIATAGSHQSTFGGGDWDAFLVKFNTNGVRQSATYYGGTGSDWGYWCTTDASGNVYMTGETESSIGTVIATTGSHQPANGGGYDAYLVKFACAVPSPPSAINGNTILCSDWGLNTYSVAIIIDATSYIWTLPNGWSTPGNSNIISTSPGSSGVFTVTANNACGASQQQNLNVIVSACTGLEENSIGDLGINIFPNPNHGTFELELNSDNDVTILNAIGQIVYASKVKSGRHQINLESFAQGIYLVNIGNTADSKNIKMIKE